MGFMDSVSVFTQGVGQKAKGNYEVVAMNAQISALRREITEYEKKLGELYFSLHKDDPEEQLKGVTDEIKTRLAKIDELNGLIETTKEATAAVSLTASDSSAAPAGYTGRVCLGCGKPLPASAVFCGNCGTKNDIQAAPQAAAPAGRVCSGCGQPLADDAVFCGNCGTKNEMPAVPEAVAVPPEVPTETPEEVPEAPVAPVEEPVVAEEQEVAPAPAGGFCPNCGASVDEDTVFCGMCGTKVK